MKARGACRSPLRASQAAATRERIVEACVALMHRGADLTYACVAAEAEVQERTVYRHFPKKEDLEAALWDWIIEHLTHADFAANEEQLVAAMRESFAGFDAAHPSSRRCSTRRRAWMCAAASSRCDARCSRRASTARSPAAARPCANAAAVLQVLYSAASWDLCGASGTWTPPRPPTPSNWASAACSAGCASTLPVKPPVSARHPPHQEGTMTTGQPPAAARPRPRMARERPTGSPAT